MVVIYWKFSLVSYLLSDHEVSGYSYRTFQIEDHYFGNGFTLWYLGKVDTAEVVDNAPIWVNCKVLALPLERLLLNNSSRWIENSEPGLKAIWEVKENSYSAYILKGSELYFVSGFQDFGGTPPSIEEKEVCLQ